MLNDRFGGAAAGKHLGRRLTTRWHGSEQPLPTHGHASTLRSLTCVLGDPGDRVGRTHATSSKDHRVIPATLGGSAAHLDLGAEGGEGRHGTALPHKRCPKYRPEKRKGHSSAPRKAGLCPVVFRDLPSPHPAPRPAEQEILTGGTGR